MRSHFYVSHFKGYHGYSIYYIMHSNNKNPQFYKVCFNYDGISYPYLNDWNRFSDCLREYMPLFIKVKTSIFYNQLEHTEDFPWFFWHVHVRVHSQVHVPVLVDTRYPYQDQGTVLYNASIDWHHTHSSKPLILIYHQQHRV